MGGALVRASAVALWCCGCVAVVHAWCCLVQPSGAAALHGRQRCWCSDLRLLAMLPGVLLLLLCPQVWTSCRD